ncbi:MAG: 50S ribosome-binding GTPase, partial [Bacillota bacterium]|nr:50S ribosome-binding GTPase [Bacillota bacterium]
MKSGFVSFVGRPNVGKSSLVNALVGAKVAIISEKPQTTRRRIMGVRHFPGGQMVFLDTPGLHKPKTRLGEEMVRQAMGALSGVDVVGMVVDLSFSPGPGDREVAQRVARAGGEGLQKILILNKMDLLRGEGREERIAAYRQLLPPDTP